MPSIRVGFGSDYVVKNQNIGIGTDNPRARLDVVGALKGDISVSGVNTLSVYEGFVSEFQNVNESLTLTGEFNSPSEDIIVGAGVTFEVSVGSTFVAGSLESISVQSHFSVPNGGTSTRTTDPVEGMVRFNDDLNTLEFWNGFEWRQFTVTGASGRGVFMGGQGLGSAKLSSIEYVNIHTLGNAVNFGTLVQGGTQYTAGCSSSTRGILGGGYNPQASPGAVSDTIEYITIASEGNSIDFGNLSDARGEFDACSSSTRGVFCGGEDIPFANMNVIDYIEISTLGNALDFGDMNTATRDTCCLSSPTRGIIAGGVASDRTNRIEFFTIAAKGNSILFGELTGVRNIGNGGCSNSVRGLFGGGQVPYTTNVIDYITIASTGNAQDFGDLSQDRNNLGSVSTQIRGMWGGGYAVPAFRNNIDYVTIASTGNAQDFGDLASPRNQHSACSDSHGGLGGF